MDSTFSECTQSTSLPREPIGHTIAQRLHSRPAACAIRFRGASISNAALLHGVCELSRRMGAAGLGHGTRAGVCLERGPTTLALLLALWLRGAAYVPLDPLLPRERLFALCEAAELEVVITDKALHGTVATLPSPLFLLEPLSFDRFHTAPGLPPCPGDRCKPDTLAYVLFTSGSSGTPKGVRISQGNVAALFAAALPLLELAEGCRVLGCASFSFDIAFFELLAPLLRGGTLILADTSECASPPALLRLIEREGIDVVQATPSHWQLLNALPWRRPVATAIATGEPLLRDTAAAILRNAATLWNLYGPTECTIWCSGHRVTARDLAPDAAATVSIGAALPGYVLQLEATDTDEGATADELVIGGDGVGLGYCGENGAQESFRCSPRPSGLRTYRSGDLCRRDAQGLLHFTGRRDSQAKHNGYRVEPDEIALLLRQHMSIRDAACLVRPASATLPSLLFACVSFRRGMPNRDKAALNAYLATWLPRWMLPQRYFFVERLPLTANGKLDRAALFELTTAPTTSPPAATMEQAGSLEARVAAVFCEVLDVDHIGPCDSFLDAGGSSMLAATLVMTLNERLGCALSLRQALAAPPTVGSIVQLVRASSQDLHDSPNAAS